MEIPNEGTTPQPEEQKNSSPDQLSPPEEPIILNKLFPKVEKDLDALFPDPGMKKLLKNVVKTRQKNERFLKRINWSEIPPEED
jgi:hypothetical protein